MAVVATKDTGWIEIFCPLRAIHFTDIQMDSNCRISYQGQTVTLPHLNILSGPSVIEAWDATTRQLTVRLNQEDTTVLDSLQCRIRNLAMAMPRLQNFAGIFLSCLNGRCVTFHVMNPLVWRDGMWSHVCAFEKGQTIRWAVRFKSVHIDYSLSIDYQVIALICMKP